MVISGENILGSNCACYSCKEEHQFYKLALFVQDLVLEVDWINGGWLSTVVDTVDSLCRWPEAKKSSPAILKWKPDLWYCWYELIRLTSQLMLGEYPIYLTTGFIHPSKQVVGLAWTGFPKHQRPMTLAIYQKIVGCTPTNPTPMGFSSFFKPFKKEWKFMGTKQTRWLGERPTFGGCGFSLTQEINCGFEVREIKDPAWQMCRIVDG